MVIVVTKAFMFTLFLMLVSHITASTSHIPSVSEDDDISIADMNVPWEFEREPPEWLLKLKQHQQHLFQKSNGNIFDPNLSR
jgi:hypothetical protein